MSDPLQGGRAFSRGGAGGVATDGPGFAAIVAEYEAPLLRYVGQILGPASLEAEDVVQETFLRLHRQMEREGPSSIRNLKTWLFKVAHNAALDVIRKRGRERSFWGRIFRSPSEVAAREIDKGDELAKLAHREACEQAMAELQKLPDTEREVLLLKVTQDLTLREIGEVTGLSVGNVDYRLNKGLRELASRLKVAGVI